MSRNILTVPTKSALEAVVQHEQGEIAFCEEDKTYYCYGTEGWQQMPVEMTDEGITIDLYSLKLRWCLHNNPQPSIQISPLKMECQKYRNHQYYLYLLNLF